MSNDLSLHHGLIGNLFTLPKSHEERDRYRLTTEQVEFFHEHGYLKGIRLLSESQVEALRHELQELTNPASEQANNETTPNSCLFNHRQFVVTNDSQSQRSGSGSGRELCKHYCT